MIREDDRGASFDGVLEVSDSQVDGQQFAAEGAVLLLSRLQSLREVAQREPGAVDVLLERGPDSGVGGVDEEAEWSV